MENLVKDKFNSKTNLFSNDKPKKRVKPKIVIPPELWGEFQDEIDLLKAEVLKPVLKPVVKFQEHVRQYYLSFSDIDFVSSSNSKAFTDSLVSNFNLFNSKEDALKFQTKQNLFNEIIATRDFVISELPFHSDIHLLFTFKYVNKELKLTETYKENKINCLNFESMEQVELFRKYISDNKIISFLLI